MFYIPNTEKLYYGDDDWVVIGEVQYPAHSAPDAMRCTYEPCMLDGTEYIISEDRNGPVIGWTGTPRDPDEVAALKKANADAVIMAEIDRLERSITDRMWREDAVGSTALMEIRKQDENGDWVVDNDDPRTGKTATQYIAWVNDAIAALRAGL